jgi:hypothetical protein
MLVTLLGKVSLRVWGFLLGFGTQSCCAKIEHQQNNPCTLLLTLLHFFTEKIIIRQERKKHLEV